MTYKSCCMSMLMLVTKMYDGSISCTFTSKTRMQDCLKRIEALIGRYEEELVNILD